MAFASTKATGRAAILLAITLVATACSSTSRPTDSVLETAAPVPATIPNEGGSNEGHTPIGFPGTGTGLFVGDNLNPGFPNGDGVQTYLTFTLPDLATVDAAELASDLLQISGTPFTDLGELLTEPVEYTTFGADIFDLPASGDPTTCTVVDGNAVTCDVTAAVRSAIARGDSGVQFRLRFERVADNDGQPDLAMFYRTDSNINEEGLFTLVITGS